MKKVKDTKYPTVRQATSMSENLREKFKRFSNIQVSYNSFSNSYITEVDYLIYVENKICKTVKSWQELLSFYYKLMEEESDE